MKKKKCKGTGKALNFGCGKYVIKRTYGLCNECYKNWLFNSEEGKLKINRSIIKAKKDIEKETKKLDAEKKIESKSIRGLIIEAKAPFQKLIRIRDHRKTCICCDKILPFDLGAYDAGHFKKAELYSGLIFHPDNVHGQTKYCNKYLNGNESSYAEGLKNRIGIERFENLVRLSTELKNYKWDRQQLIDLKKYYSSELRLLESGNKDISEVDFSIGILAGKK